VRAVQHHLEAPLPYTSGIDEGELEDTLDVALHRPGDIDGVT
jgi:hypothetical protein